MNTHGFRNFQSFFLVSGHRLRDIDILTAQKGGVYIYEGGELYICLEITRDFIYSDWGKITRERKTA